MSLSAPPPPTALALRATQTLVAALAACVLTLGYTASPAAADECPNAALRAQNNSSELPDCRAYEMVTPPYKEGFALQSLADQTFTDDGTALSFVSTGNVAGNQYGAVFNQYVARRGSTGWTTESWLPPADQYGAWIFGLGANGLSADLERSVWTMRAPSDADYYLYLREPDGAFTHIGLGPIPSVNPKVPYVVGQSADLSHVVFVHGAGAGSAADAALYEFVGTDNDGLPRSVSVDNDGEPRGDEACFVGMSVDGRVIVFGVGCRGTGTPQLRARVGGSATVSVSGSECTRTVGDLGGVCNGVAQAEYAGAAKDGSRVFFTTTQQLVNGDIDQTADLYACDIPAGAPIPVGTTNSCASLRQVSGGSAAGARVEQVAAVSDDGSQVYFVAQGVLADNVGTNDAAPVSGDANLYLWTKDAAHPAGQARFVVRLDTSGLLGGSQMTPDGRYLVFGTASKLVTAGPGNDTDDAVDMYRYDEQTNAMVRLSTAVSGSGGNGAFNAARSLTAQKKLATGVTDDGSMVVFVTGEALSARDVDGGPDVYAWHDGHVALISDGVGGALDPWITPSGSDIFFLTGQRLTAADGDANADVYDARVGGGFDLTQPTSCSGDGCQGQRSALPNLVGPSSAASVDLGAADVAASFSLRRVTAAQRERLAATGKVKLTVTANRAGTVRVSATTVLAGRSIRVGSARQTMTRAGRATLTLTLSKTARARLAARGKLAVKVVVGHSKVARGRSVTLRLSQAKPGGRSTTRSFAKRALAGRRGGRS